MLTLDDGVFRSRTSVSDVRVVLADGIISTGGVADEEALLFVGCDESFLAEEALGAASEDVVLPAETLMSELVPGLLTISTDDPSLFPGFPGTNRDTSLWSVCSNPLCSNPCNSIFNAKHNEQNACLIN